MITHLEKLWCAMFVSEGWYESWRCHEDYPLYLPAALKWRQLALRHKAIGIVEFDRMLNQYEDVMKSGENIKDIFVFGEKE